MSAATLNPAEIKVRKGHQVRHVNGGDADFDKSVATLGVLVPLLVENVVADSQRYPKSGAGAAREPLAKLVDGHLPVDLEKTRAALVKAERELAELR